MATITQTQTLSKPTQKKILRFKFDPEDSDDGSPFGSPKDGASPTGRMSCDKIVHVYDVFRIQSKIKETFIGSDGRKYYTYTVVDMDALKKALENAMDPVELKVYLPYIIHIHTNEKSPKKNLSYVIYETSKTLKPNAQMLLVRCANNSVHIVPSVELLKPENRLAYDRFLTDFKHLYEKPKQGRRHTHLDTNAYKRLQTTKTAKNTKTPDAPATLKTTLNFEREARKANHYANALQTCYFPTPPCRTALKEACAPEMAPYPRVNKAIQAYGARTYGRPEITWEETCHKNKESLSKHRVSPQKRRSSTAN
jgi:hypothetical protein